MYVTFYILHFIRPREIVGDSSGKGPTCANAGDIRDMDLIPGSERFPGEGNGNPLQYSCMENSMDKGTWWVRVHGISKSWTQLNN